MIPGFALFSPSSQAPPRRPASSSTERQWRRSSQRAPTISMRSGSMACRQSPSATTRSSAMRPSNRSPQGGTSSALCGCTHRCVGVGSRGTERTRTLAFACTKPSSNVIARRIFSQPLSTPRRWWWAGVWAWCRSATTNSHETFGKRPAAVQARRRECQRRRTSRTVSCVNERVLCALLGQRGGD